MTLLEEIQAKCTPEQIVGRNYHSIAATVSAARRRVRQPHLVGKGTIADALGMPAGPVFVYALKTAAAAPMPDPATAEQIAEKAMVELAWELINTANFDVGLPSTRAGLDLFVGKLPGFTQAAADAIKNLASVDDPVDWAAVQAVFDAHGV